MKHYKCNICGRTHESNAKIVLCKSCLTPMTEFPKEKNRALDPFNADDRKILKRKKIAGFY